MFQQEPASDNAVAQLSQLCDQRAEQASVVAELEKRLKDEAEKLRLFDEELIPGMMDDIGLDKITTKSGLVVTVEDKVTASIPAARKPAAFAWLRENGFGDLIKHQVVAKFGMEEDEEARKVYNDLGARGYDVDDQISVHSSTLTAFAREQLKAGTNIPMEDFGIMVKRVAKIK